TAGERRARARPRRVVAVDRHPAQPRYRLRGGGQGGEERRGQEHYGAGLGHRPRLRRTWRADTRAARQRARRALDDAPERVLTASVSALFLQGDDGDLLAAVEGDHLAIAERRREIDRHENRGRLVGRGLGLALREVDGVGAV